MLTAGERSLTGQSNTALPCSEQFRRSAEDGWPGLAYQYRTPIDCTPIDSGVIANSAARLLGDVPDNTTRPEHPSFAGLIPETVHPASVGLLG